MAEGGHRSLEGLLECSICFDQYDANGDHIPRLLPCSHTFCETCIKQLLQQGGGNRLACPVCKAMHKAKYEIRSFPQNKYTLALIRQKPQQGKKDVTVDRCKEHDRKLKFYCKEQYCQRVICMSCVKTDHKAHDWVEIEEEGWEILNRNIESAKQQLNAKLDEAEKMKEKIKQHTEQCVRELKTKRDELKKQLDEEFNKMIKEAEEYAETNVDEAATEHLILLNSLKQDSDTGVSVPEFINSMEIVRGLRENQEQEYTIRTFRYPVYEPGQLTVDVERMCGQISFRETQTDLAAPEPMLPVSRPIINASKLQCTVTRSINTGFSSRKPSHQSFLGDTMAVCGLQDGQTKLKVYNSDGGELQRVKLDYEPYGTTGIILNNQPALALVLRAGQMIEFRDAEDLRKVVHHHSVAPHQPGALCAASPTVLLYQDQSSTRREVHWLDCSVSPPRPVEGRNITHTQQDFWDMCCVDHGDKQLLVTVQRDIHVYDTRADTLLWEAEGKLPGMEKNMCALAITSDGRGHLYVYDFMNTCIQMFRASDGEYLGCLIKRGEQGLGNPREIRWCESLSSVAALYQKDKVWFLSIIEVKRK